MVETPALSTWGGRGCSIPGRGPEIPHALQCSKIKFLFEFKKIFLKMSAPESGLGTHLKAPCSYTSCSCLPWDKVPDPE